MVVLAVLVGLGSWLVRKADKTYLQATQCRYQDFARLRKKADRYAVVYNLLALGCLALYPLGLLGAAWVFGFAAYHRLR